MTTPKTLQELRDACDELGLPLDLLHVNIGRDSSKPKCFGIFQYLDTFEWCVYKNDSQGNRKVRYQGHDEAEACRIIWEKILELAERARKPASSRPDPLDAVEAPDTYVGSAPDAPGHDDAPDTYVGHRPADYGYDPYRGRRRHRPGIARTVARIATIAVLCVLVMGLFAAVWSLVADSAARRPGWGSGPRRGYYHVDDDYYYHAGDDWWLYDYGLGTWTPYYPEDDWYVYDDYGGYYDGYDWGHDDGYLGWDDWYEDEYGYAYGYQYAQPDENQSNWDSWDDDRDYDYDYDPDWDNDYDWDSGWDSGSSWDYDSDWDSSYDDYDYDYDSGWDSDWDDDYDWDSDW